MKTIKEINGILNQRYITRRILDDYEKIECIFCRKMYDSLYSNSRIIFKVLRPMCEDCYLSEDLEEKLRYSNLK